MATTTIERKICRTVYRPCKEREMPFVSQAQRGYFNANRDKLEKQGVDVDEWNQASKGLKLPKRTTKKPSDRMKALHSSGMISNRALSGWGR